jgi:hypothetical protein
VSNGSGALLGRNAPSRHPRGSVREIELAVTDDTLQGKFITDAGLVGLDGNTIGFGLLLSDDRDIVGSVEFLAPGVLRDLLPDFLEVSLGARGLVGLLEIPTTTLSASRPGRGRACVCCSAVRRCTSPATSSTRRTS